MTTEPMTTSFSCEKCARKFATQDGLISHLKKLHAEREHQPYKQGGNNETKD